MVRASLNWRASSSIGSRRSCCARTDPSVMAMAHATASVCVYDSESGSSRTPSACATCLARPVSTAYGRPFDVRRTSTSRAPMPWEKPVPNALSTASFAAKRVA